MIAQEISVLLVEDSPSDAEFVRASLGESKGIAFELTVVQRLAEATAWLREASAAVVLLDLGLPDSQGLATLQEICRACGSATAIVVLTGNATADLGTQAIQLGAQDFLNKKHLTEGNVLRRCVRFAYERKRRELAEEQLTQIRHGMKMARAIQQHLLPEHAPRIAGFDIAGICRPADATGGDLFDYFPMADGRLGIVLADVASHGFAPALIMALTRRALRTIARTNSDPGAVLTALNQPVCEDVVPEHFVTLFLACLDPPCRSFTYAGAGHDAHLFDAQGRVTHLESTGAPLGVEESSVYGCRGPLSLEPGDLLLLQSDGFCEAYGPAGGPQFGLSAVLDYVAAHRQQAASAIVEGLVEAVQQFTQSTLAHDDRTVVVVKRG